MLIKLGKIRITILYPIIAPLFCFCNSFLFSLLPNQWTIHFGITLFFLFFSQMLIGLILELISIFLNSSYYKGKAQIQGYDAHRQSRIRKIRLLKASVNIYQTAFLYASIVLNGIFYFLIFLCLLYTLTIFTYSQIKLTAIILQIAFASFLCHLSLSYDYHKHHILSYSIMFFGGCIVLFGSYDYYYGNNAKHPYPAVSLILYYMGYFCMSIKEIIDKWLMDRRFIRPQRLLLIEAFTAVICSIIYIRIFQLVKCQGAALKWMYCLLNDDMPIESFGNFALLHTEGYTLLYYCLFSLSFGCFAVMYMFTNYHYTPIHRSVSDTISTFLTTIVFGFILSDKKIEGQMLFEVIAFAIGYLVLLFSILVFNEFVICCFWGLDVNTKEEIMNREFSSNIDNNENNDNDDVFEEIEIEENMLYDYEN